MRLAHILNDNKLIGALTADLLRYYGKDLKGYWRQEFSWVELATWVRHLPSDSALGRRGLGDEMPSMQAYLLADISNQMRVHDWHFVSSKSKKGSPAPRKPDLINLDPEDQDEDDD